MTTIDDENPYVEGELSVHLSRFCEMYLAGQIIDKANRIIFRVNRVYSGYDEIAIWIEGDQVMFEKISKCAGLS